MGWNRGRAMRWDDLKIQWVVYSTGNGRRGKEKHAKYQNGATFLEFRNHAILPYLCRWVILDSSFFSISPHFCTWVNNPMHTYMCTLFIKRRTYILSLIIYLSYAFLEENENGSRIVIHGPLNHRNVLGSDTVGCIINRICELIGSLLDWPTDKAQREFGFGLSICIQCSWLLISNYSKLEGPFCNF